MIEEYREKADNSLEGITSRLWKKMSGITRGRKIASSKRGIANGPTVADRLKAAFYVAADIVGFRSDLPFDSVIFPVLTCVAMLRFERSIGRYRGDISMAAVEEILRKLGYDPVEPIMETFDYIRNKYRAVRARDVYLGVENASSPYSGALAAGDYTTPFNLWSNRQRIIVGKKLLPNGKWLSVCKGGVALEYRPIDYLITIAILEEVPDPLSPLRREAILEKLSSIETRYYSSERKGLVV